MTSIDRRTFLQGVSTATLSSVLPTAGWAAAPPPRGAVVAAATSSLLGSFVAPKFNSGRSQVNLNFLQIGGDYPFLNCLKNAQSWTYLDNSGPVDPSTLDSNGYPTSISHGGIYTVFDVPSQTVRPGITLLHGTAMGRSSAG